MALQLDANRPQNEAIFEEVVRVLFLQYTLNILVIFYMEKFTEYLDKKASSTSQVLLLPLYYKFVKNKSNQK